MWILLFFLLILTCQVVLFFKAEPLLWTMFLFFWLACSNVTLCLIAELDHGERNHSPGPHAVLPEFTMVPWYWERLKAGGEGAYGGWDGWMASPTWWKWAWASSRSWWWTGKPGMLQSMESQSRAGLSNWTELNWTEDNNPKSPWEDHQSTKWKAIYATGEIFMNHVS